MIVSNSINLRPGSELNLSPSLVRGLFLIWQSELKSGQQFAEVRELDRDTRVTGSFTGRAFGLPEDNTGYEAGSDSGSGELAMSHAECW